MKKIGYKSDKFDDVGDEYEYVHDHDPGVGLYEGCDADDDGAERAPRWPTRWACLGDLWKVEFVDDETGNRVDAVIPKGMWLLCSPDSRLLVCLHPSRGFYAAIFGGKMRVTARGIEG